MAALCRLFSRFGISSNNVFTSSHLVRVAPSLTITFRDKSTKPKRRKRYPFHWWYPKERTDTSQDLLTDENKQYLADVIATKYSHSDESPLREERLPVAQWTPESHRTALIAKKIGIYPMWSNTGKRILATLLHFGDNHVIHYIPPDVYAAEDRFSFRHPGKACIVVGTDSTDPNSFEEDYLNKFKESGVMPKKKLAKFIITPDAALNPGTPLYINHFRVGDYVNCYGRTIEHGFQGVMKRWGMKGGPATHGTTKAHRRLGAIGDKRGKIQKGKKMPGHMGGEKRLFAGVKILRMDTKHNVMWVRGPAIPGQVGDYVYVYDSYIEKKCHNADNPPPFPTYFPDRLEDTKEGEESVAGAESHEVFDKEMHVFGEASVVFAEDPQAARRMKQKGKAKTAHKH